LAEALDGSGMHRDPHDLHLAKLGNTDRTASAAAPHSAGDHHHLSTMIWPRRFRRALGIVANDADTVHFRAGIRAAAASA